MTNDQLIKYAASEVTLIKRFATPEELARIRFKTHKSAGYANVYADMAGSIESDRAQELIKLCATTTVKHSNGAVKVLKNGEVFKRGRSGYYQNLSALEWFLLQTHFDELARMPIINFFFNNAPAL